MLLRLFPKLETVPGHHLGHDPLQPGPVPHAGAQSQASQIGGRHGREGVLVDQDEPGRTPREG